MTYIDIIQSNTDRAVRMAGIVEYQTSTTGYVETYRVGEANNKMNTGNNKI